MGVVVISIISLVTNAFLGKYRKKYKKMTFMWLLMIHASIPLIVFLRIWLGTPNIFILVFIGCAVLGQAIGSKVLAEKRNN
ncbi:MAG: hypothetical protein LBK69_01270 [Syntrophomonadaceae bacterium]|jgi:hypothetical protein|nr:hypothetical protein [Syntrophomonadaceae bacterium]